jgi:hypothetical protein
VNSQRKQYKGLHSSSIHNCVHFAVQYSHTNGAKARNNVKKEHEDLNLTVSMDYIEAVEEWQGLMYKRDFDKREEDKPNGLFYRKIHPPFKSVSMRIEEHYSHLHDSVSNFD